MLLLLHSKAIKCYSTPKERSAMPHADSQSEGLLALHDLFKFVESIHANDSTSSQVGISLVRESDAVKPADPVEQLASEVGLVELDGSEGGGSGDGAEEADFSGWFHCSSYGLTTEYINVTDLVVLVK
jgi:hypothetical protein